MTAVFVIVAWFLAAFLVGVVVGGALTLRDAVQVPEREGVRGGARW